MTKNLLNIPSGRTKKPVAHRSSIPINFSLAIGPTHFAIPIGFRRFEIRRSGGTLMIMERAAVMDKASVAVGRMKKDIEEQVKGFGHRGINHLSSEQPPTVAEHDSEAATLVERITSATLGEVDKAVLKLEDMRRELMAHNDRIQQEVRAYEGLAEAAHGSLKSIVDSLAVWKSGDADAKP